MMMTMIDRGDGRRKTDLQAIKALVGAIRALAEAERGPSSWMRLLLGGSHNRDQIADANAVLLEAIDDMCDAYDVDDIERALDYVARLALHLRQALRNYHGLHATRAKPDADESVSA
jgi:hypothetical protein